MNRNLRTLAATVAVLMMASGAALAQGSAPASTPAAPAKQATPAATTKAATHHTALTKDQIKAAQEGLAKGGYYKGKITGVMDKATTNALKAWQKANKMPANGHLNEEELQKLSAS